MKHWKKAAALALSLLLTGAAFVSCSNSPSGSPSSTAPGGSSTESAASAGGASDETYTVKIVFPGDATSEACEEVAAAASEITAKFGVKVDLLRIGYGSFQQEVNLMISSNEKLDLMPSFAFNTTTAANNGQIIPLDDLLASHGQDMLAQISDEDWACCMVNGKIYAIPNNKEKAQGFGIAMRKDMFEAAGVNIDNAKSESDLTELYRAVKAKYPDTYPLVSDAGQIGYMLWDKDDLGGDFGILEHAMDASNRTVVNLFETEAYREIVENRYAWAQEGLIMPDASTSTEQAASLIASGKGFSFFTNTKPGIEAEWGRKVGQDMIVKEIIPPFATTSGVANTWYIVQNSEQPEKAMQTLNEMYTNPELADLLINGIEGKHYVRNSEVGVLDYPEGVTAANTTYSSVAWCWLNELISTPWITDGPDVWKDTDAFNKSAANSIAKGYQWNNENVLNEITACNNVTAKYANALNCGSLEPETTLAKMNEELKSAGLEAILAEKQKQLDAWFASQN